MAKYKSIVITNAGLALVAAAHSGDTIEFTGIKSGNGVYDNTEVLEEMTDLKSVKQTFGVTGITREESTIKVRSVLTNDGVTDGYYITEIGLYALDSATGTEILYAVIVAEDSMADYFPSYSESPQSMTLETYITATGVEDGVTFTASIVAGTYVTVQDFEDYKEDTQDKLDLKPENVSELFNFNTYNGDISTLEIGMYVYYVGKAYVANGVNSPMGDIDGWCKIENIYTDTGYCYVNVSQLFGPQGSYTGGSYYVKAENIQFILTTEETKYLGMLASVWGATQGGLVENYARTFGYNISGSYGASWSFTAKEKKSYIVIANTKGSNDTVWTVTNNTTDFVTSLLIKSNTSDGTHTISISGTTVTVSWTGGSGIRQIRVLEI